MPLTGSFDSLTSDRSLPRDRPHIYHEPLPNIWSKVPPIPPKQDRKPAADQFRPHAELLLHLRRSAAFPSSPSITNNLQSPSVPYNPMVVVTRPSPIPSTKPPTIPSTTSTILPLAQLPPPMPIQFIPSKSTSKSAPTSSSLSSPASITPVSHHRPRRANDYTGEFKREFCALLSRHSEARSQWENFWRRRECTGRRPCIKSYLAFCEQYAEFSKLRRSHKYRVLGTRTSCECSFVTHSTQPIQARFSPY